MSPTSTLSSVGLRRDPIIVMNLARLGSFHQHRLSFMRILLRKIKAEKWIFKRHIFAIDANGEGHAVYVIDTRKRQYSLIAFAHNLDPNLRSDRVIATAWDATFTLFDGIPSAEDLSRLQLNVPLQEAGRVSRRELSISRANRSTRLWEYVLSCLAQGDQPDVDRVNQIGYLMRTTAVYGSGKLGASDREEVMCRPEFRAPFQIEMLVVWMIRNFTVDLIEYMAQLKGGKQAVKLDHAIRKQLGIGNSTGLGMVPFLLNHPLLLHKWINARERALAMVRVLKSATEDEQILFKALVKRSKKSLELWKSKHSLQQKKIAELKADHAVLESHLNQGGLSHEYPWNSLWLWAEKNLRVEGQEFLLSLLLEPYGHLVDHLADEMSTIDSKYIIIKGKMKTDELQNLINKYYDWVFKIDWSSNDAQSRFWYTSKNKLEPRLGKRVEDLEPFELPLAPGRDVASLYGLLQSLPKQQYVADFLQKHPKYRHCIRRIQMIKDYPYSEIRDNTIDSNMMPIDLLRAKLSFFGAQHFDPFSDRWVRISMYRGAPYPDNISTEDAETWGYPLCN